ncbi:Cytochrome P450 86A1 [Hordeum vulgare]|nr:Cytochrome P450 86A1 [Hordeum vulgare]
MAVGDLSFVRWIGSATSHHSTRSVSFWLHARMDIATYLIQITDLLPLPGPGVEVGILHLVGPQSHARDGHGFSASEFSWMPTQCTSLLNTMSMPWSVVCSSSNVHTLLSMAPVQQQPENNGGLYLYMRSSTRSRSNDPASVLPTKWPILGMLPSLIANIYNFHEYSNVLLAGSGLNFNGDGPPGAGMRFFITCDPANIQHIFTTNYSNFPKGAEFAAIFDIMAGGFFTIDGELWRLRRMKFVGVISSPRFADRVAAHCHDKVKDHLLPLLARIASTSASFDMQEIMARLMFDITALTVFGVDPGFLSLDMPPIDASLAMDTVMEVGFLRHTMPASLWKTLRWLNIGHERRLHEANKVLRRFVVDTMERRKTNGGQDEDGEVVGDILSLYINDPDYADDDLLCGTLISFMLAGRDTIGTTLPWIFYSLAQNPNVVSTICSELSPIASHKVARGMGDTVIFEPEETKSLVYLRATLYETLRLYPPAHMERKTVVADDTMPSGHEVYAGDAVYISLYSMGRMESLWGKDCLDFNPNRWLLEDSNKLKYVPSNKFLAFNSGPRMCPGKEIAVVQMKTIIAAVVWNFDLELVEGQSIQPKLSCLLQMKNGLMMKLKKREA